MPSRIQTINRQTTPKVSLRTARQLLPRGSKINISVPKISIRTRRQLLPKSPLLFRHQVNRAKILNAMRKRAYRA